MEPGVRDEPRVPRSSQAPQTPAPYLEPEQHADGRPIEVEVADSDADHVGAGLLEIAEVAIVEAQADVVGEIPHHASADIPAEIVLRKIAHAVQRGDVLIDPADTDGSVRTDSAALLSANWNADNQVRHQRDDAGVVDAATAAEEAG